MRTVGGLDIGARSSIGQTDLPRLREGGVGAVFFAAYVSPRGAREHYAPRGLEAIDTILHDIVARYPNDFVTALNAGGIVAARIGVEGGHAIQDSLRVLRDFYRLGARCMTLTHANTNDWADSSGDIHQPDVKHHNGLTGFGQQVVGEMNRLGMMADVSHVSDKTFWDVLEVSRAPP